MPAALTDQLAAERVGITGSITVEEILLLLQINTATIYAEYCAGGSNDGTTQGFARDATITRTAAGRWDVAFSNPHPDGANYHISLTAEEQSNLRDTPDMTVVQGSKSATGFQIQVTTGDNGGTADTYIDTPWSFSVSGPVDIVSAVFT